MNFFKKNQIVVFTIGLMLITAGYLSYMNNNKDSTRTSIDASSIADSEEMASIGDAKLVSANVAQSTNEVGDDDEIISNSENSNLIINSENIEDTLANNELVNSTDTTAEQENAEQENAEQENNENLEVNGKVDSSETDLETGSNSSTTIDEYFTSSRLERENMYSKRIENYQDILNNSNVSEAQKKMAQEEITKLNNEQNALMITENLLKTKGISDLIIFVNGDSINVIVKGDNIEKEKIAQIQNVITRELDADIGNVHITTKN